MRLLATMIVRDEADRYLDPVLDWLVANITPHVAVYDDASTDGTVDVAAAHGCAVTSRPADVPSLLDDEATAREAAWRWMDDVFDPDEGEWVLAIDADEFFVAAPGTFETDAIIDITARAEAEQADAVMFGRAEVFGFDETGTPLVRTDAEWGRDVVTRLVRWRPAGSFDQQAPRTRRPTFACGSAPTYVQRSVLDTRATFLHFGHAREADRREKHARYLGRGGHNRTHIDSILRHPVLERWAGKVPILQGAEQ